MKTKLEVLGCCVIGTLGAGCQNLHHADFMIEAPAYSIVWEPRTVSVYSKTNKEMYKCRCAPPYGGVGAHWEKDPGHAKVCDMPNPVNPPIPACDH